MSRGACSCLLLRRGVHMVQLRNTDSILPASTWNGWNQIQNRQEPRVLESCFAKLPHGGFVRGSKPFFALDVPRARGSSAALDVRNSRAGRKSRNTFHTVRHDLRTLESRNQNIPCWPLLGRNAGISYFNSFADAHLHLSSQLALASDSGNSFFLLRRRADILSAFAC